MFKQNKIYKITYQVFANHTTFIAAKDTAQALKRFRKNMQREWFAVPDIISIQEVI